MKKIALLFLVISGLFLSSCKKDVSPELEVTVVDAAGQPVIAKIKISVDGVKDGVINARAIDSSYSDAFGKAYFKFDNTILVDATVYNRQGLPADSVSCLCETKKLKKDEKNIYERKLVYR